MPFNELLKTLLTYALLLVVLTIPVDLVRVHPKKAVKALAYAALLLLLGALFSYVLFLSSFGQSLYFLDPLEGLAREKTCPALSQTSAAQRALTQAVEVGEPCNETMHFGHQYEFGFRAEKSGYPSEPLIKGAYNKGQPAGLYSVAGVYDFTIHDAGNRLLGKFQQDKNYFVGPDSNRLALEAGRAYKINWAFKEKPFGFKPCKTPTGLPEWQLNCLVPCGSDGDCGDGLDASADSCVFPGTCHGYCKRRYLVGFTTTPDNALENVLRSPEYKACAK